MNISGIFGPGNVVSFQNITTFPLSLKGFLIRSKHRFMTTFSTSFSVEVSGVSHTNHKCQMNIFTIRYKEPFQHFRLLIGFKEHFMRHRQGRFHFLLSLNQVKTSPLEAAKSCNFSKSRSIQSFAYFSRDEVYDAAYRLDDQYLRGEPAIVFTGFTIKRDVSYF